MKIDYFIYSIEDYILLKDSIEDDYKKIEQYHNNPGILDLLNKIINKQITPKSMETESREIIMVQVKKIIGHKINPNNTKTGEYIIITGTGRNGFQCGIGYLWSSESLDDYILEDMPAPLLINEDDPEIKRAVFCMLNHIPYHKKTL